MASFAITILKLYVHTMLMVSLFSLSVRPDPPQCQYLAKDNKVTWKYPKTWSTPESYFPLTFRVKTESAKKHTNKVKVRPGALVSFNYSLFFIICTPVAPVSPLTDQDPTLC